MEKDLRVLWTVQAQLKIATVKSIVERILILFNKSLPHHKVIGTRALLALKW